MSLRNYIKKEILPEDGLWIEPIHGTTGSGNFLHDTRRRWKTISG